MRHSPDDTIKEASFLTKVGTVAVAGAGALSIALAAFGIHAASSTDANISLAGSELANFAISHSGQLEMQRRIQSMAPSSVGEAMIARLSEQKGLPSAQIAIVMDGEAEGNNGDILSSFAMPYALPGSCAVIIVLDHKHRSTIERDMARVAGFIPGAQLGARISDFEILHELGHCAATQLEVSFELSTLTAKQNQAIAAALKNTPQQDLWNESFADAYAALHLLESSKGNPQKIKQTQSDIDLELMWRKMSRLKNQLVSDKSQESRPSSQQDPHLTEMTLEESLSSPRWMDASIPLEKRASQLASIGLVRSMIQSQSQEGSSPKAPLSKSQLFQKVIDIGGDTLPFIVRARSFGMSKENFKGAMKRSISAQLERLGVNKASSSAAGAELAALMWDLEIDRKYSAYPIDWSDSGQVADVQRLARVAIASQPEWGLLVDKISAFSQGEPQNFTQQAWQQALAHQSPLTRPLRDPRPEALAMARNLESAGEGSVAQGFYHDPESGPLSLAQLEQWRGAKNKLNPNPGSRGLEPK